MKTMKMKTMLLVGLSGLLMTVGGCAADDTEPTPPTDEDKASGTLVFAEKTPGHVSGTYTQTEGSISFDLEEQSHGSIRRAVIRFADGSPLLESEIVDGVDTVKHLGGRLTFTGAIGGAPTQQGDAHVLVELATLPEAQLVGALRSALVKSGVEMLSPDRGVGGLHPNALVDGWVALAPSPLSFLSPLTIPTWSFWGTTTIVFQNRSPWPQVGVLTPTNNFNRISYNIPYGGTWSNPTMVMVRGQYWGLSMDASNGNYGGSHAATIWVTAY